MPNIVVDVDGKAITSDESGMISIHISESDNNIITGFNESGGLMTGEIEITSGGEMNTPGNSIGYVESSKPLRVIQCNSSVSRVKRGDPDSNNEGVYMPDLISKVKESLSQQQAGE